MTTPKLPATISSWEIAGIPAAALLATLYEMEMLPDAVKADLPRLMLLAYIIVALVRAMLQRAAKTDKHTGIRPTRTDVEVPPPQ